MFSKRKPAPASITVIAAGSLIEGTMRVQGTVQVDGTVGGMLVADGQLSIGPEGRVTGDVEADSLSVAGSVEGNVTVRGHLHILRSGRVQGDARYASLEVDRGGVMDGRTALLEDDPKAASENDNDASQELPAFDAAE